VDSRGEKPTIHGEIPSVTDPPTFSNSDLRSFFFLSLYTRAHTQEDEQLGAYVRNSHIDVGGEDDPHGGAHQIPVRAFAAIGTRLNRTAKQCRERWKNYLRDGIKKGDWTPQEEELIRDLYRTFGSRCVRTLTRFSCKHTPHLVQSQLECHGQVAPEPVGQ
jgi:hypothetical protein